MSFLPFQVGIGKIGGSRCHLIIVSRHVSFLDNHFRRLVVEHVSLLTIRCLHTEEGQPVGLNAKDLLKIGIARYRPDGQQILVTAAAELVGAIVTAVGIERKQLFIRIRQCGISRHHVALCVGDVGHIGPHPTPITGIVERDAAGKSAATVVIIATLRIVVTLVVRAGCLKTKRHIDVMVFVLAQILIVVSLQTGRPTYVAVFLQGELATIGHGAGQ